MAKNYMQDVAKLLGIEPEEEFKLTGYSGTFVLTNQGMTWIAPDKRRSREVFALESLLIGRNELVKLPWTPKTNEAYYRPSRKFFGVTSEVWTDNPYDYAFKEAGMIFRTAKECEAALPELRKKYLGGDDNV